MTPGRDALEDPVLWMALVLLGVSCALAVAVVLRACAVAPAPDRRFRDRPPLFWALTAPLVHVLVPLASQVAPARFRLATGRLLRMGGLERALDSDEAIAGAAVAAALGAAAASGASLASGLADPSWVTSVCAAVLGAATVLGWLRDRAQTRRRSIDRQLPFYLEVLTLALESGANLTAAIAQAVEQGPSGALRSEFDRVLRDLRAGRTRVEALRGIGDRIEGPAIASLIAALLSAERHGSGLGAILRAQAEQRRAERFARAERLAMQAPVRMLFPLLVFIFPCTFVLVFFPVVVRLLEEGLIR